MGAIGSELEAERSERAGVPSNVVELGGVLLGYNHDVPHAGRVFHIQTEASGRRVGRIITHVFDSGTIVASNRASYERGTQRRHIVELARDSHKLMMRRLVHGELDAEISRHAGCQPEPASASSLSDDAGCGEEAAQPARPARVPELVEVLDTLRTNVAGTLGVALVDYESGMCLGTSGTDIDLEVAAAGNMEVMKAKARVMRALGIPGGIEDILITLESQYHIIRPVGSRLFLYLAMDRKLGNLALARHKLAAAAVDVKA